MVTRKKYFRKTWEIAKLANYHLLAQKIVHQKYKNNKILKGKNLLVQLKQILKLTSEKEYKEPPQKIN